MPETETVKRAGRDLEEEQVTVDGGRRVRPRRD